jgi:hypothetical protein
MFDFHDVEQNTDEWFAMRGGRLTSSKLAVIMATPRDYAVISLSKTEFGIANMKAKSVYKKRYSSKNDAELALSEIIKKDLNKSFGAPALQYAVNIAIEQITGNAISSTFSNEHMERGHEQEPDARALYEYDTFCDVTNGGFFCNEFIGCSPDGLVGDNGVIEIKSVIASVHYSNLKRQNVDPAYKWQCIGNLKFTGRDWMDFISYCAEFPDDKKLFIHRIQKDDLKEEFKMIDDRIELFKKLVEDSKTLILESSYTNY